MTDEELREAAHRLLSGNLRQGVSPFDGQPYSFCVPSSITYPYQWFWDSCFHAVVWTYFDLAQAKEELRTLLRAQARDGRIPHRVCWDKRAIYPYRFYLHSRALLHPVRSQLVQPPVLATALEIVHERSGDGAFLAETLPAVERFYRWLARRRDPDGDGLVSIIHPYESGLDHKPSYDVVLGTAKLASGRPFGAAHGRPWATGTVLAVRTLDLWNRMLNYNLPLIFRLDRFNVEDVAYNCIYAQGLASLSRLWKKQGDPAKARLYDDRAKRVERAVLERCRGPDGFYYDLYSRSEKIAPVKTVSGLFPLILDDIPAAEAERLVKEYVLDERQFWLPYPLPTCAVGEPAFDPSFRSPLESGLWRGPTWVCINWFIVRGLQKHGFGDIAATIARRTRELVEKGGFREFYNPYTGRPHGARAFGWSTLVVDMLEPAKGRGRGRKSKRE
ncbi:MAG: hypothetical protein HYS09_03560 [Chloroflexi bacterium]|nr:hypothetical protein [Chloroflexota bacterium]